MNNIIMPRKPNNDVNKLSSLSEKNSFKDNGATIEQCLLGVWVSEFGQAAERREKKSVCTQQMVAMIELTLTILYE